MNLQSNYNMDATTKENIINEFLIFAENNYLFFFFSLLKIIQLAEANWIVELLNNEQNAHKHCFY